MTAAAKSIPILLALTWAAFLAAKFDRPVEIKFDPARDGPITFETPRVRPAGGTGGVGTIVRTTVPCLTSLATGTGATGTAFYTACPVMTSTSTITTGGTADVSR